MSKYRLVLSVVILAALMVLAGLAQAQPLTQTVTLNGFTVSIPGDWVAEATDDEGIVLASSEAAVQTADGDEGEALAPGETAILMTSPADLAEIIGSAETAREVLETFLGFLDEDAVIEDVSGLPYDAAVSEAFSDILPGGRAYLYVLDVDGVFIFAAAVSGDDGEGVRALAEAVLATMTYEAPARATSTGTLVYGDEVSGEITNATSTQAWEFVGQAGDVVTITMQASSSGLDTLVSVYTAEAYASGALWLDSNDDATNGDLEHFTDSQIEAFELPADGTYVIEAGRFSGEGAYTLTLALADEESSGGPSGGGTTGTDGAQAGEGGPIAYGETVRGALDDEGVASQFWTFSGQAGDIVTITMIADDTNEIDPRLYLFTSDNLTTINAIAENDDADDDSVGRLNSQIFEFQLPETGDYVIEATQFGFGAGTYSLTLDVAGANNGGMPDGGVLIAYGDEVTGTLTDTAETEVYQFDGLAGDVVTITMIADDTEELDTRLYLYTAEGFAGGDEPIAENDDANNSDLGRYDSQIVDFELPEDGSYTIEATRFGGGAGAYTLRLESSGAGAGGKGGGTTGTGGDGALRQWASDATGSSQYGEDSWSFMQATGEPNTPDCGDFTTAWASATSIGEDFLQLSYDEAVIPTEINIYQSYTPGSIIFVIVGNSATGEELELRGSADEPGNTTCPGVFSLAVSGVDFPVDTVTIYVDQTIGGSWNEIDAVELVGNAE